MALFPLSLSIGVLAGVWFYLSVALGLLAWPTFVGWAIFFFTGGNKEALVKAFPPMLVGLVLGYLTVVANKALNGDTLILSILVVILAFVMTFMMNISWLAAAPAAFASAAVYFGVGDPIKAGIPLFLGLVFGIISVWIPGLFVKSDSN
jgi:Protein of unknown function (DUF1097).